MTEKPLSSLRCEFCGGEFKKAGTAKKDIWGRLYTVPGGYYLPFKCPRCGGLFCEVHRLPENHLCLGKMRKILHKSERPTINENKFNQQEYNDALPSQPTQPVNIEHLFNQPTYDETPHHESDILPERKQSIDPEPPQKTNSRFSQGDYDKTLLKENLGRYLKVGIIISILAVGFYYATNTTMLTDLSTFIQTQASVISSGIASLRNNTATTGIYKNYQLGLVKSPDGVIGNSHNEFIVLINNRNAKNPSFSELLVFLKSDKTDEYPYQFVINIQDSYTGAPEDYINTTRIEEIIDGKRQQETPSICADFAERLHNNAEMKGIRCAYLSIDVGGSGHALNAFETTDRGIVYIDSTGMLSGPKPLNNDKIIDVLKVGANYVPRGLFPELGWSDYYESLGAVTDIFMTWDGEWR